MSSIDNSLPEGTDSIIDPGTARDGDLGAFPATGTTGTRDVSSAGDDAAQGLRGLAQTVREQAGEKTIELREQAGDRARDYAEQGKARATAALEQVSKLISDTAATVDEKVGSDYGDYARRAATAVDGLAASIRDKDVDALVAEARDLVRRSPGLAVTAAAVIGFALVRIVKSGLGAADDGAVQAGRPDAVRRAG